MEKLRLSNVTLLGLDYMDIDRLLFASDVCQKHISFGDVKLLSHLPSKSENITKIGRIRTPLEYHHFFIKEMYKYFHTDYVLVIQWNGFILNPLAWKKEFLEFDYVGPPWTYQDQFNVGNGRFSLRSKKIMQDVAKDRCIFETYPEDKIICRTYGAYLQRKGFKFAPEDMAKKFGAHDESKWSDQFGFHQADISDWEIMKFADPTKHARHINSFFQYFPRKSSNGPQS